MFAEVAEVLLFSQVAFGEDFTAPFAFVPDFVDPLACSVWVGDVFDVVPNCFCFGFPIAFESFVLGFDFLIGEFFAGFGVSEDFLFVHLVPPSVGRFLFRFACGPCHPLLAY